MGSEPCGLDSPLSHTREPKVSGVPEVRTETAVGVGANHIEVA